MPKTQPVIKPIRVNRDIVLRRAATEYAQDLFLLTDANRDYLKRWLPWLDSINSAEDSLQFIQQSMRLTEQGKGIQFFIFFRDKLSGVVGFHNCDAVFRRADIGYWLDEKLNGYGIMTTTVKTLIDLGFENLKLRKIGIRCAVYNRKSRMIPERLGFKLELTKKQCEWLYDHYVDHAIYSLHVKDYLEMNALKKSNIE